MEGILGRPALRVGRGVYDVGDVVMCGLLTGAWQDHGRATAERLAAEAQATVWPETELVVRALTAFRYSRQLVAVADLVAWLEARELTLHDLERVLRRQLLPGPAEDRVGPPATASRLGRELWAEALCSGTMAACVETLRCWVAAGLAVPTRSAEPGEVTDLVSAAGHGGLGVMGPATLRERAGRLVALRSAHRVLRETCVTDDAIDARVDERRLAWTTVHGQEITFDGRGAAAEARLCLTDDRCPVDAVASLAGVVPVRRSVSVSEVSTDGDAALLAARPGAVVGPWAVGSQWRIFLVTGRVAPDPSAPEVRQRARTELADEVILRLAARVVVADGIN